MTPKLAGGDIAADIAAGQRRVRDPPPTMKRSTAAVLVVASLGTLYVGGYWGLIRKNFLARMPGERVRLAVWVFYEPLQELDLRWNHDRPILRRFKGTWKSATMDDFVRITDNGPSSFRLGEFTYTGPLNCRLANAEGFRAEFHHKGAECVFVFQPEEALGAGVLSDRADVFVGHRPHPDPQLPFYHATMTKARSGPDEADPPPARPEAK